MSSSPKVTLQDATLRVSGAMTMDHANALEIQGAVLLRQAKLPAARVDLSATEELDSSALAVLFSWQRLQASTSGELSVVFAPEALHTLVRLYGVGDALHWG